MSIFKYSLSLLLFIMTGNIQAEQVSPSANDVIASWPDSASETYTYTQALTVLNQTQQFGHSAAPLKQLIQSLNSSENSQMSAEELTFIEASILQRNHNFSEAAKKLSPLNSPSSLILLASVYNNLGLHEKSAETCKKLASGNAHLVALTCMLDARFQQTPSAASYQKLQQLAAALGTRQSQDVKRWVNQTLAFMALSLERPDQALTHIEPISLNDAATATVSLWGQAQLALQNYSDLLSRLSPVAKEADELDDSILLLLATAEKQVGTDTYWQTRAEQRISLRIWRQDWSHAAYIARYYLDVKPDEKKAQHYARINYDVAKGLEDKHLLKRTGLSLSQAQVDNT